MEGWQPWMLYLWIGRITVFVLGVLAVAGITTLGLVALSRVGILKRPIPFFSVLVCVLVLYLLALPYRVYNDVLAGVEGVLYKVERFLEEASGTIASLHERYAIVAVPSSLEDLQRELQPFAAQLRRSWGRAKVLGGVLALLALILGVWGRMRSSRWMQALAYGSALITILIPILMGVHLAQTVAQAEWNRPQEFTLEAKTPPNATGQSGLRFDGISVVWGSQWDLWAWLFYTFPLAAPLLLLGLRSLPWGRRTKQAVFLGH